MDKVLPPLLLLSLACIACRSNAAPQPPAAPTPARAPPAPQARAVAPWLTLTLGPAVGGFDAPVHVTSAHDGSGRLFVVEQGGRVWALQGNAGAPDAPQRMTPAFLDVSALLGSKGGEQGLLGLAFHPRFKENHRLFIGYTDDGDDNAYAELRTDERGARADASTLRVLLSIDDFASNHNGGHLAFGKDGLLYLGTGDGGGGGDPERTAQDPRRLLGKMLTVDVDHLPPAGAVTPTVRFRGLRNPWRYAFDDKTGDLFIADVGQNQWEEVNVVPAARLGEPLDFGWSRLEGAHCFRPRSGCDASGTEPPVFEVAHGPHCSITGGVVFRGAADPDADGTYLFGDYCSGALWTLRRSADGFEVALALESGTHPSSFGTDDLGGVWLVDHGGALRRVHATSLTPSPPPSPSPRVPPTR